MPVLSAAVKLFVVRRLAAFDSPTEVARAVKVEFGIDISRQHVESHNPDRALAAHGLSAKWRTLFDVERRRFLDDMAAIPISHRPMRLRTLDRLARRAEDSGNLALAASLMEQAAREMGNFYANRRLLAASDSDGPIRTEGRDSHNLDELSSRTTDELIQLFSDAIGLK